MKDYKATVRKLGNFILYNIDDIIRDKQGNPLRFKTSKEIREEIRNILETIN